MPTNYQSVRTLNVFVFFREEEETSKGMQSVKTFFSPGDKKKHRFFKDRCLTNTVEL